MTTIRSGGFCFLHAVSMILGIDHDEVIALDKMLNSVLDHMAANVKHYK